MTSKKKLSSAISAFARVGLLVLSAHALFADTYTYTYTGNTFTNVGGPYTTADFVTATLTFNTALGDNLSFQAVNPTSFSISDGRQTWTNLTSLFSDIDFSTDATGDITSWDVAAGKSPTDSSIETEYQSGSGVDFARIGPISNTIGNEFNLNLPGTWTIPVTATATPEPGLLIPALGMFAFLGGMVIRQRRRAGAAPLDRTAMQA